MPPNGAAPAPAPAPAVLISASPPITEATPHADELPYCVPEDNLAEQWLQDPSNAAPFLPAVGQRNLWEDIVGGFQLSAIKHARIQSQKRWFLRNPDYMERVSRRATRYLNYVVNELKHADMPLEIALLPIVESAFDPFAYSHGRASGMWQFIGPTGRQYGMEQNWWYDGRRDVVSSTAGAIAYLTDLHQTFDGDWLLALAAYNTGEGNVKKAIRRNRRAGKPGDFWSLRLPRETRAYVPRLLAVAELLQDRANNGLPFLEIAAEPYFTQVDIGSQLDLAQAAAMAGIDTEEIYLLNPGLNRWATPPDGPHRLLIPTASAEQFKQSLRKLPAEKRVSWQRYTIQRGDTLSVIARRFHTTVGVIKNANRLKSSRIREKQTLLIPAAIKNEQLYSLSEEQRLARKAGNSRGGTQRVNYTVRSGDSLWSIAKRFNVSIRNLAYWNDMVPKDTLRVGQSLTVWTRGADIAQSKMIRKVGYKVRRGDSLYRIARRFNLETGDITRWNDITRSSILYPGQRLTLYVDVRNSI